MELKTPIVVFELPTPCVPLTKITNPKMYHHKIPIEDINIVVNICLLILLVI